jgi:hypothetical protein
MADDKSKRGKQDRSRVSGGQDYEVRDFAQAATRRRYLMLGFAISTIGSPNAEASEPAVTYKCDKRLSQSVRFTEDADFIASTSTFGNVVGANASVVVPTGETRCLKLRFDAAMLCSQLGSADHCYVQVTDSESAFPLAPGGVSLASESASTHGFEWAAILSPGSHSIHVQARSDPGGTFLITKWVLEAEVNK